MDFHFLDLNDHETISNKISEAFHVDNRSPQILLIKDGECIFEESHSEISLEDILQHVTVAV
jgi:bacillithiol system protein YtxJ